MNVLDQVMVRKERFFEIVIIIGGEGGVFYGGGMLKLEG